MTMQAVMIMQTDCACSDKAFSTNLSTSQSTSVYVTCRHYSDAVLVAVIALCTLENDVIHAGYLALALYFFRQRESLRTSALFRWLPLYNFGVMLLSLAYQAPLQALWHGNPHRQVPLNIFCMWNGIRYAYKSVAMQCVASWRTAMWRIRLWAKPVAMPFLAFMSDCMCDNDHRCHLCPCNDGSQLGLSIRFPLGLKACTHTVVRLVWCHI